MKGTWPPTPEQLKYAQDLGISVPDSATGDDVGFLIRQFLKNHPRPTLRQLQLAKELGIVVTEEMSPQDLKERITTELEQQSLALIAALPFLKKNSKIHFEGKMYRISYIGKIRDRWIADLVELPSCKRRTGVRITSLRYARHADTVI